MPSFDKILVPLSLEDPTPASIEQATAMAAEFKARLTLAHAAPAGCAGFEQALAAIRRQSKAGQMPGNGASEGGNKGKGDKNPDDEGP